MNCPTCGQKLNTIRIAADLVHRMKENNVGCYMGQDRNYYLERGLGQVDRNAIDQALAVGAIKPRWDDAPQLEYWKAA